MSNIVVPELLIQGALSLSLFGLWIVSQSALGGRISPSGQRCLQTGVFAFAGWLTLSIGLSVETGVLLDQRGAIIGLATAYSGLAGGAFTAAVCAMTRGAFGGQGALAGLAGIGADYAVAVAVVVLMWRRTPATPTALRLAVLGLAVGITEAWSLTLIPVRAGESSFLQEFGTDLFTTQVLGTLLFGSLIEISEERKALSLALEDRIAKLDAIVRQTVDAFTKATVHTDPYTAGHEARVADLCVRLGRTMGFDADRLVGLEIAAKAHDIGQIKVPSEILLRPRRLSPLEYEFVKQHTEVGWEILHTIDFPWPIADIVRQHHENYDGSGYPRGLRGEQIRLEARIIRVADMLEALCSHRPFRTALPLEEALERIKDLRGTALDPLVVDQCLRLVAEDKYRFPAPPGDPPTVLP